MDERGAFKTSRWRAIRLAHCPRCREGHIFQAARWPRLPKMHDRCPVCELKFEREQGYFLGAMYVSYGLALVIIGAFTVAIWFATRIRFEMAVLFAFMLFLPLVPPLTVVSRVLWIHFDQGLDPER